MAEAWLTGWKAIASYLDVSVATAMRNYELRGLPVMAVGNTKIALPEQLDQWQKEKKKWTSCVYFIYCEKENLVKIGFTRYLERRFNNLKTMSPSKIVLLGSIEGTKLTEEKLHAKFNKSRAHGEWFRLTKSLSRYLREKIGCSLDGLK